MNKIVSLADSQPARTYFYPVVIAIVAYLVSRGVIDSDTASWITGIVAAVVGVGATESVHAAVRPKAVPPAAAAPSDHGESHDPS